MFAARKSSSTEREADAPYLGQRTSGWHETRCSLVSHCVTNHTLAVRGRAKSPGAPQTSTLSFFHILHKIVNSGKTYNVEQFYVVLRTVPPIPLVAIIQLFFNYFSRSDLSHRINHHCGWVFSLTCHLE